MQIEKKKAKILEWKLKEIRRINEMNKKTDDSWQDNGGNVGW